MRWQAVKDIILMYLFLAALAFGIPVFCMILGVILYYVFGVRA